MENTFASFQPITLNPNPSQEDIANEYKFRNETLDNDYLNNLFGLDQPTIIAPKIELKDNPSTSPKYNINELLEGTAVKPISTPKTATISSKPKNKKEFLERYAPLAEEASKKLKVPKDYLLAQIALETGWGKHTPGNNVGGIKPGKSWKGKTQVLSTKEFENGQYVTKPQTFRAYDSPEEGFQGYVDFLLTNNRYSGLKGLTDPNKAAEFIGKSGYATDPNYTNVLKNIIKQVQTT